MTWALRLLPIWRWLAANPLIALCAILAAWAGVERHQAHKWQDRAESCQRASQAAQQAQAALRTQETHIYRDKANDADANYRAGVDRAADATRHFVDTRRVQPGSCRPAIAFREAGPTPVPTDVPTGDVVVDEADVQHAAEWQAFGLACRDWALSITGDE